ncbi:hypothetical protein [Arthrobacter sp. MP_M7]|nr:putative flavoprotein YhiN [Arthrobacter sp. MP_M4]MEC5201689.1 putative flavoprotein YhiN [Arthrobacter sp. MP_M7]
MDSAKNLPVAAIGGGPIGLVAEGAAIEQRRRIRLFSPRNRGMQ